jgi:ABC-2 type transport system permease protein
VSTAEPPQELRPVRGPTMLGGSRRRFWELLMLVSVTEFKRAYFGTALGYFWSLLRPLMLFAVLLVVFTQVFRVGSGVEAYPVLLLFNIVLFGFFQESTLTAVSSIVDQERIVRKTAFPRLIIPLAVVVTALFNLALNMIAVFVFVIAYGVDPQWTWLLFPVIIGLLFIFTIGTAMIVSSLFVRYRDVGIIWSVVVTALFYGTPVLYPLERVPGAFKDVVDCNPLTPIFQQARAWIIDPNAPGAVEAVGGWDGMLPAIAIFLAVCVLGVWFFNREAPRIAEDL